MNAPEVVFVVSAACASGTRQEGMEMHAASVLLDMPASCGQGVKAMLTELPIS